VRGSQQRAILFLGSLFPFGNDEHRQIELLAEGKVIARTDDALDDEPSPVRRKLLLVIAKDFDG
jgi:hypothetical protein